MTDGLKKIGFALVPLVVIGAAVELGLRSAGWPRITASFEHNEPFWITDSDLRAKSYPHKEENSSFSVTTNGDGLRFPMVERTRTPDRVRVMAMGCSTTFGWGVDDAHSYPAQFQALAVEQGLGQVEVINAGQPGYTSFQGRWLWEEKLVTYRPDVVLLGYVVQDARKAAYSDRSQAVLQQDHRYMKNHVLYKSRTYLWVRSLVGGIQIRAKERDAGGKAGEFRVPPADFVENIRTLVAAVQAEGATPILFGFPLEREGYTSTHRKILKAAAMELDVRHLDLQERMDRASREAELYFVRDRGHANVQGNERIAEWVLEYLVNENLLGPGGTDA